MQEKERHRLERADRIMSWRRYVIDVIVVCLISCAVASFVTAVYAFADRGEAVSTVGWFLGSVLFFGLAFVGWCIQEVAAEHAADLVQAREEADRGKDQEGSRP